MTPPIRAGLLALCALTLAPGVTMSEPLKDAPPLAKKKDHVTTWHGSEVNDPWFWLREKTNPEVIAYLEAENAYTEAHNPSVKHFGEALYTEILGRIKQTDLSVPERRGAFYYYSRTEEGKQYPIMCRRKARADGSDDTAAAEQILLDLNALAAGHKFFAIGAYQVSDDGHQLLYSTDLTGFRQYTLYAKDLTSSATTAALAERVTSAAWMSDNRHYVYVTEDPTTKRSNQIWRAALANGKPELLFEEKDELFYVGVARTRDKAFLVCSSNSTDTWEARLLASADTKGRFRVVLPREKGHKYAVDHRAGLLYIRTNKAAKNFRLVTAPIADPSKWTEVIAHRPDTLLDDFDLFEHYLVVHEKREALERFRFHDFRTAAWKEVTFPESVYTAHGTSTPEWTSTQFRLNYQSMVTPPTIYDARMSDGELTMLKRTEVLGGFDSSRYVTERRWAVARDGVKVPLSVLYKKGTRPDAKAPCFLYGYGSYGLGMSASFSIPRLSLVDRGMVFVIAHIRGGDELGEPWHDDGMLLKKKNSFFDFIDAAEWLLKTNVTSKDKLVIEGASAGGLLMGAVVNLRPDLWRAVHLGVPFVDLLNTMFDASLPLTIGEYLEWGNPNEKPAFEYMRSYSPYDNLEKKPYPAMLVTTSINDSQVMYWEPAKYVAKLRHTKTDRNPLFLKCNMGAGHGGASGRYDRLKEVAFEYAWLMSQVGITK
jgi:oligopeptidase B